jgi:hypothetical protein
MKLKYDDIEIEVNGEPKGLTDYARSVLYKMQKADAGMADCWTACIITMNELNPDFTWGSIDDLSSYERSENNIYVELPIVASVM